MLIELSLQVRIIISSILSGIMIGFLFDFYRIIRGKCEIKIICIIQDILFWILSAICVFTFLLYRNYAFLNIYVYLFIMLSLCLYLNIFSKRIYNIEIFMLNTIRNIFRIVFKTLMYPVRLLIWKGSNKN